MKSDYESLFNKYRPHTFADLIGQEHISLTLTKAFEKNRLSQAYLLCGNRGSGKTTTARILAMGYNCEQGLTANPCGKCQSCQDILNERCIDIVELDAASKNKVEDIRDLTASAATVPSQVRVKFYIIDEGHRITPQGQDAFLKTLEEPPPHVVFVICTTEAEKLKDTIISRCQVFEFRKISIEKICERLKWITQQEKYTIDEEAVMAIARTCNGGMRDAIGKLDQAMCAADSKHIGISIVSAVVGSTGFEYCAELFDSIVKKDVHNVFQIIGKVSETTSNLLPFYISILSYCRGVLGCAVNPNFQQNLDITVNAAARIIEQSKSVSIGKMLKMAKTLLQYGRFLDSIKGRMALETMLLDIMFGENEAQMVVQPQQVQQERPKEAITYQPLLSATEDKKTWSQIRTLVNIPIGFIFDSMTIQPYYDKDGLHIYTNGLSQGEIKHIVSHSDQIKSCLQRIGYVAGVEFIEQPPTVVKSSEVFGG